MAITIRHGVNTLTLDRGAGKTVGDLRQEVEEVLNVPPSAQARLNGAPAEEGTLVGENAQVEFVKAAGEKGVGARS